MSLSRKDRVKKDRKRSIGVKEAGWEYMKNVRRIRSGFVDIMEKDAIIRRDECVHIIRSLIFLDYFPSSLFRIPDSLCAVNVFTTATGVSNCDLQQQ